MLISIIIVLFYMFKPISVEFTEIATVNTDKALVGSMYNVITNAKQPLTQKYNIPISAVDFDKNYILISFGREISRITYTRGSKYTTPYKGTYLGLEIYKKKFYEHTIFVYKIKKIHLINEQQAEFPYKLRLEE